MNGVLLAPANTMLTRFARTHVIKNASKVIALMSIFSVLPALASPLEDHYPSIGMEELSFYDANSFENHQSEEQLKRQLANERYRTAILQERAKQRRLIQEEELTQQERRVRDITADRYSQEADYRQQSNDLDLFNDVVNSIGNIAAQAGFISSLGRRNGW
jgi:hypothetical protein